MHDISDPVPGANPGHRLGFGCREEAYLQGLLISETGHPEGGTLCCVPVGSGVAGDRLCSLICAYTFCYLAATWGKSQDAGMAFHNSEYLGAEGYALIGAAFEVHRELGGGMSEEIYQESFELELGFRSIKFIPKGELQLYYKGHLLEKKYYPDLIVSGEIITELKSVKALNAEHERQLLNYMRITRKAIGYLVNFGPLEKLEWKRFILKEYVPK